MIKKYAGRVFNALDDELLGKAAVIDIFRSQFHRGVTSRRYIFARRRVGRLSVAAIFHFADETLNDIGGVPICASANGMALRAWLVKTDVAFDLIHRRLALID